MPATALSSVAVHARPSISAHRILTLEGSDIAEATSDMDFSRESSGSLSYSVLRKFIQIVLPIFGWDVVIGQQNKPVIVVTVLY